MQGTTTPKKYTFLWFERWSKGIKFLWCLAESNVAFRWSSNLKVSGNPCGRLWHKISCPNLYPHTEYVSRMYHRKFRTNLPAFAASYIWPCFAGFLVYLAVSCVADIWEGGKRCVIPAPPSAVIILHLHWRHSPEPCVQIFLFLNVYMGLCGGAVGWGTALQAGRSRARFPMVSSEFFIDKIHPTALWPRGRLSLKQKWEPGIFPGA